MKSLVSIIVPNYNHSAYLRLRIDSILRQSYQNFEIILLDDASTDNSINILEEYAIHPKVNHIIINKQNSGSPFIQWKKGVELSKGDYIWIAESDDWNDSSFLIEVVTKLDQDPTLFGAVTNIVSVDESGSIIKHWNFYKEGKYSGDELLATRFSTHNYILNASAIVFRKSLVDSKIDWDKIFTYKFCGDWLFWGQLANNSYLYCIEKELCFWRKHRNNVTTNAINQGLHITEGLEISIYLIKYLQLSLREKCRIIIKWKKKINANNEYIRIKSKNILLNHFGLLYRMCAIYTKLNPHKYVKYLNLLYSSITKRHAN